MIEVGSRSGPGEVYTGSSSGSGDGDGTAARLAVAGARLSPPRLFPAAPWDEADASRGPVTRDSYSKSSSNSDGASRSVGEGSRGARVAIDKCSGSLMLRGFSCATRCPAAVLKPVLSNVLDCVAAFTCLAWSDSGSEPSSSESRFSWSMLPSSSPSRSSFWSSSSISKGGSKSSLADWRAERRAEWRTAWSSVSGDDCGLAGVKLSLIFFLGGIFEMDGRLNWGNAVGLTHSGRKVRPTSNSPLTHWEK